MGKLIPPCGSYCPKRHPGCHGKCEKYLAFRAAIEAARPENYAAADADDYTRRVKQKIALRRVPYIRRNWNKPKQCIEEVIKLEIEEARIKMREMPFL